MDKWFMIEAGGKDLLACLLICMFSMYSTVPSNRINEPGKKRTTKWNEMTWNDTKRNKSQLPKGLSPKEWKRKWSDDVDPMQLIARRSYVHFKRIKQIRINKRIVSLKGKTVRRMEYSLLLASLHKRMLISMSHSSSYVAASANWYARNWIRKTKKEGEDIPNDADGCTRIAGSAGSGTNDL